MKANFKFQVRKSDGETLKGLFYSGAGMAVALEEGSIDRRMVRSGVDVLAHDRAAVSVNLVNGWVVERR